ncbi:MAG: adenine deaminase [Deltaproteobacteria bacterium]|nr:adenine deaminase [Deltaproteobacteria bacterium]
MIPCDLELRLRLLRVAQGLEAPDLLITGGRVWNAFTGEVLEADVAVCGERIAWAGPGRWSGPVAKEAPRLEAGGKTLVPGYVEPHTHPWPFANPLSLGEAAVCHGTTCLVYDELLLHLALGSERLARLTAALSEAALPHVFWVARMASQSRFEGEDEFFSPEVVSALLARPEFKATGEMTRWTDFLDPARAPRLVEVVEQARRLGKFADGHTAGASRKRLPALAATGLRSCHEATDAAEALDRLRQGFWVLLRHSSLRPDLTALLPILGGTGFLDRVAFTTDGARANHVAEVGLTDHVIALALAAGVPANHAYRMATLNAAAFLGLDQDLGAIAPGRVADINVLENLDAPTPRTVICRGRLVARDGVLAVPAPSESFAWGRAYAGSEPAIPSWGPEAFLLPFHAPNPFPTGRLANAVITREAAVALEPRGGGLWPVPGPEPVHCLALTDRNGSWISRGAVSNLAVTLDGLASTYTTNGGTLVLGTSPDAMALALARLRQIGGGMVVVPKNSEPRDFPLPLAGIQMPGGFGPAARAAREFQDAVAACGYAHADPNFTLLFLSCDFLPDLRATQVGWVRIKTGEILLRSESRP